MGLKMDNLANYGVKTDEMVGSRRLKPRGKRKKRFVIESRITRETTTALVTFMGLDNWWVHSRYTTRARRDQAYAVLVKKSHNDRYWKPEYRKRDD
jgi:hypothetical protein